MDTNNIILFVGAIALLIIVHEFGHYVIARLTNVEIEEFGLGYPPRAVKLFTFSGTIFSLNWILLGGFVRSKGENDPTVKGGLAAASPWVRLAVFLAGPLMNFLAAAILFSIIFARVGMPDTSVIEIVSVSETSPAEGAGMQEGDIITEINGLRIDNAEILRDTIAQNAGKETAFVYQRGEQLVEITLVPRENPPPGEGSIGIFYSHPLVPISFGQSLGLGVFAVYDQVVQLVTLPGRVIQGSIAPEQARLVGYKGMFDIYQNVRESDAAAPPETPTGLNTMAFFASISISLGLLNLLPIPALDGGRILFTLPEIILRRRIPPNYENAINLVSFAMLILLMIYINIQDFVNPAEF